MRYHDIQITGSLNISGSITIPAVGSNIKPTSPPTGSIFLEVSDSGSNLVVFNGSGSTGYQQVGVQTVPIAPSTGADIEYLVVAGGGGAGWDLTAGGGAGGLLSSSLAAVASGSSITVTVGAGGAGYTSGGVTSTADGTTSSIASSTGTSFTTVSTVGGGGGSRVATNPGRDGGSGGGCGRGNQGATNPGSGTAGQGNDGGADTDSPAGTGGGGAGAAGGTASGTSNPSTGGNGGDGLASSITGTSVTYAGGGGGGGYYGSAGTGGSGGGGNGSGGNAQSDQESGEANKGGGAGGGGQNSPVAASGGSGVVILAYPTGSGTGTGGTKTSRSDGQFVHTFKESGTFTLGGVDEFPAANAESFNILTWTGNDSNNRDITGLGFKPDWVWIKRRNSAEDHAIYDSVRGVNKQLSSDTNGAQATNAGSYLGMSSFDTDGFNVGNNGGTNRSGNTYVGWCWKAGGNANTYNIDGTGYSTANAAGLDGGDINPTGASINTVTGFGIYKASPTTATQSISHGLSQAPDMYIFKTTDISRDWYVSFNDSGTWKFGKLNSTDALGTTTAYTANSSTMVIGGGSSVSEVIYAFHSVKGYQKIGTYTGTGTSGNSITTGFKPKFVLTKSISATGGWRMFDSVRGTDKSLRANIDGAEYDDTSNYYDFESTGFAFNSGNTGIANSDLNGSGVTYLYLAIAE